MHSAPKSQSSTSAPQIVIVGMNWVVVVVELAGVSGSRVGAELAGLDVGEKVSSEVVGSEVVGSEVVGSEVVGTEVVGSEVVGEGLGLKVAPTMVGVLVVGTWVGAEVGEVVGSEVVGSEVVGSEVVGEGVGPAVVGACDGGGVTKMRTKIAP